MKDKMSWGKAGETSQKGKRETKKKGKRTTVLVLPALCLEP